MYEDVLLLTFIIIKSGNRFNNRRRKNITHKIEQEESESERRKTIGRGHEDENTKELSFTIFLVLFFPTTYLKCQVFGLSLGINNIKFTKNIKSGLKNIAPAHKSKNMYDVREIQTYKDSTTCKTEFIQ